MRVGGDLDRILRGLDELLLEARCRASREEGREEVMTPKWPRVEAVSNPNGDWKVCEEHGGKVICDLSYASETDSTTQERNAKRIAAGLESLNALRLFVDADSLEDSEMYQRAMEQARVVLADADDAG